MAVAPGALPPVLDVGASLRPADVPSLCDRVRALLEESGAAIVLCDVAGVVKTDVGCVGALARIQLTARRLGRRMVLHGASRELCDLLAFTGLAAACGLGVEPRREAEEREERLGRQEEGELADPAV